MNRKFLFFCLIFILIVFTFNFSYGYDISFEDETVSVELAQITGNPTAVVYYRFKSTWADGSHTWRCVNYTDVGGAYFVVEKSEGNYVLHCYNAGGERINFYCDGGYADNELTSRLSLNENSFNDENFNNYFYTDKTLYDEEGNVFFSLTEPKETTLAPLMKETEMNKVLLEILGILPVVLIILIGLIGLHKALAMLFRILRTS